MSYITYEEYTEISSAEKTIPLEKFSLIIRQAERYLDRFTLTVDNVRKLKVAFPTDEDDSLTVKECVVALVNNLADIEAAEEQNSTLLKTGGGGLIASASSGSESVTYALPASAIEAASDPIKKSNLLYGIVRGYLEGVQDENGVNLLYGGKYPCIVTQ